MKERALILNFYLSFNSDFNFNDKFTLYRELKHLTINLNIINEKL